MNVHIQDFDPASLRNVGSLDKVRAERVRRAVSRTKEGLSREGNLSLSAFTRLGWHVVEPARAYVHGWHIDAISEHLTAVSDGQINRVLINEPPGMMKSLETAVFYPAWQWGPYGMPSTRVIGYSHETSLSTRDALRCRRLITSEWYRSLWGDRFELVGDQNQKTRYENNQTGFRVSDYVGGGTGERGDLNIVDDPLNVNDGESDAALRSASFWLSETLPTRLNDPDSSSIVIIMQRIHERDPSGEVLAKELGYEWLMLPMEYEPKRCSYTKVKRVGAKPEQMRFLRDHHVWLPDNWKPETTEDAALVPEFELATPRTVYKQDRRTKEGELLFPQRFPKAVVERDKKAMTAYAVAGQFQQRPAPRGGGMFKRHWFEIVDAVPADCQWVRRWDLASTKEGGAYTAGVLMGRSKTSKVFYVSDVKRDQIDGDEVKKLIRQTAALDAVNLGRNRFSVWLPQDPGQAGKVQARDFTLLLAGYDVHTELETGDKETRARPFAAQAEAGNVKLLKGDWNEAYLHELAGFPTAKFKDQVDASSGAFGVLITYKQQSLVVGSVKGLY